MEKLWCRESGGIILSLVWWSEELECESKCELAWPSDVMEWELETVEPPGRAQIQCPLTRAPRSCETSVSGLRSSDFSIPLLLQLSIILKEIRNSLNAFVKIK